jgi:chorismate mutase / prephenate dehydrogenase
LDEIPRIRERIDEIDQKLVLLLKDRYENARQLGRIKRARTIASHDPAREKIILRRMQKVAARLDLDPESILPIFKQIFRFSLQAQQNQSHDHTTWLEGRRILVVGGTGGIGRFFANFVSARGASVKIVGRTNQRTRKIAREMEVEPGSISDTATSDIVIVAVPMHAVAKTSIQIASLMPEGGLLTDLSSVKTGIADRISSRIPEGLEYVSIHPLFGPGIDHVMGQNIAAIPFKTGPNWSAFSRTLTTAGARIHLMSSEHHDRMMGYVQVLHHFALLSLGVALRKWSGDLKTNSVRGTLERTENLLGNWDTTVGIQRLNPYSQAFRKELVRTCAGLVRMSPSDISRVERILRSDVQKWSRKL